MVFFTGTPHRGKTYGFLALVHLLRPDLFDVRKSFREQLPYLREVMIRNNKQNVTDLKGKQLFQAPLVSSETYQYSDAESQFYTMLTDFILTGQAYATSLDSANSRTVMLVLITMQKLASSSVAAVRRALRGRLARIVRDRVELTELQSRLARQKQVHALLEYEGLEESGEIDQVSQLEEQILELTAEISLMEDEEPRLRELVAAAEKVKEETKVRKIIEIIEQRFHDQPVLLFTEYKATQSLVMSALLQRFGDSCVGFINGDNEATDVIDRSGRPKTIREDRETAADKFNSGRFRFLVSTEAGGEGIDLQENCNCLIHIDLPWNPMRLHQRVGRLNRYGQRNRVEVVSLRNPHTVESLIWDKLNSKITNIQMALSQVMDEPEDVLQLVLGMTSPSLFREVFAEAPGVPRERLSDWFDGKTARFGGKDVIETVRELVGHCAKFDFQQVSAELPEVDLPDLAPFLRAVLTLDGRKLREDADGLSFKTPDVWLKEPGVRPSYDRLIFDRNDRSKDAAQRVLGVGHKVVDKAIAQAKASSACVATVPDTVLEQPLLVFRVSDRITGQSGMIRSVILGIVWGEMEQEKKNVLLRDWEVLLKLNDLLGGKGVRRPKQSARPDDASVVIGPLDQAQLEVQQHLARLYLPFQVPVVEPLAILWPITAGQRESPSADFEEEEAVIAG